MVEACARVLAPHGSLCFELGDTYSGSGGAGGDYAEDGLREGQPVFSQKPRKGDVSPDGQTGHYTGRQLRPFGPHAGSGWPLAKSLSLIPESFRFAMVYGHNPFTGRKTDPWRLRNVIRWVRPNPPVGALGDKFRPATSELMVFCKTKDRYFDLDAVREPASREGFTTRDDRMRTDRNHDDGYRPERVAIPSTAPPLDWWNIPLLEGEEPTRYGPKEQPKSHPRTPKGVESAPRSAKSADRGGNWATLPELHETQGAPPLDWWNIPPGGYSGFTTRTVRVPIDLATFDGFSGDIQRIVSADCLEHGDQADPAPTESHDGRAGIESSRNPGNGGHPARELDPDSVPTDQLPLLNLEDGSSDSPLPQSTPAATRRSKASNRTAPAPATNSPGTASDRTAVRIADTSTEPPTGGPHPDTPENRTSEVSLGEAPLGTPGHIADTKTERSGEACTCSYFVEKSDNTSHYAVWPPELLIKPIKAMCPEKVCRTCGEPRRRIVGPVEYVQPNGTVLPNRSWKSGVESGLGQSSLKHGGDGPSRVAPTLGFSDCGHDNWRPGLVLDCFGGSGTTAAVATGHGRDALLIDLDERNFDLALDRVGPLVLDGPYRLADYAGDLPLPGPFGDVQSLGDAPSSVPPETPQSDSPADHPESRD